jgi:hypothetical protein
MNFTTILENIKESKDLAVVPGSAITEISYGETFTAASAVQSRSPL